MFLLIILSQQLGCFPKIPYDLTDLSKSFGFTAIVLDRCATGVLHTLEDPKISKVNLVLSNLDNPDKPTDQIK